MSLIPQNSAVSSGPISLQPTDGVREMTDSTIAQGDFSNARSELIAKLGQKCVHSDDVRSEHAGDVSRHPHQSPRMVVFPESTQDVAIALGICNQFRIPVVPFGTGTGVEGGAVPDANSVTLSTAKLNRVLTVSETDEYACVQPGVTRLQLNQFLDDRESRLFFPVDPGADAAIGGMASTNAAGSGAFKYGAMRQNVMAIEAVLADGTVFRSGSKARKSSAGFDLTRLLVGAEGTLGILTEVTVRLSRKPESTVSAVCRFRTIQDAVDAVIAVRDAGIPMARIELLDSVQMEAVRRYSNLDVEACPTLFFEFQGEPESIDRHAVEVGRLTGEHGGSAFEWASDAQDRKRLWQARYDCYYAALALRENSIGYVTDVCVPISQLAACINRTCELLAETSIPTPLLGHVGDGNFHVLFVLSPNSPNELEEARRLGDQIVRYALEHHGTCSGEHGVGLGKQRFLEEESGAGIEVMRRIKKALDPHGILNPGKVLRAIPDTTGS